MLHEKFWVSNMQFRLIAGIGKQQVAWHVLCSLDSRCVALDGNKAQIAAVLPHWRQFGWHNSERCFAHCAAVSTDGWLFDADKPWPDVHGRSTSVRNWRKNLFVRAFWSNHLTYILSPFGKAMLNSMLSPQHAVTNQLMHIVWNYQTMAKNTTLQAS